MIPGLSSNLWKRLASQPYRAMRAALGDWKSILPQAVIDIICKRATPKQLAQYSISRYAIKQYNEQNIDVAKALKNAAYINDQMPKRARFHNSSRLKIGRENFINRLKF